MNGIVTRDIDYSKTLIDDLKSGICPFRFLNKYPFYDAPDLTTEWCVQLVDIKSSLLERNVKDGNFFDSFKLIMTDLKLGNSKNLIEKLSKYLKEVCDFDIMY